MQMIISPAKKMRVDTDSLAVQDKPQLLERTEVLLDRLRELSYEELKNLWKCSNALTELNRKRLQEMDLRRNLTPAILSYEGIQYQYMAPNVMDEAALRYVQEHVRILSGFYGVVRPFDGVVPYRLEMQAKLKINGEKDLYHYWGSDLADLVIKESDCILNLASREYSVCISRYLPERVRFITCVFGEKKGGKIVEKGTMCKMARGEMVRFLAEHQAETPDDVKRFDRCGFSFAQEESDEETFVFLKEYNAQLNDEPAV